MVPRTMLPCGSRLVIMRQAVSAATKAWPRLEPAGLLDARPQFPQGAELGDGQELILVGGEAEIDEASRIVERDAALLQRAEIGDRRGKREGELLRFRTAGGMNDAPVGNGKRTGETLAGEIGDQSREIRGDVRP